MLRLDLFDADTWERALERGALTSHKVGRELAAVIGASKHLSNGADWYECYVDSASEPGKRHRVVLAGTAAGVSFACDCEGHQHGRLCWHAARALDELELWSLVVAPRHEQVTMLS